MPKKGTIYENQNSKRRVTLQIRGYGADGTYEGKSEDEPNSIQVKNATENEVMQVIKKALEDNFGKPIE